MDKLDKVIKERIKSKKREIHTLWTDKGKTDIWVLLFVFLSENLEETAINSLKKS